MRQLATLYRSRQNGGITHIKHLVTYSELEYRVRISRHDDGDGDIIYTVSQRQSQELESLSWL